MSIRIQTRILLLLAILAVLFLGVLSLNWLHQRNRMYSMLESRETEKAVLLKRVTALMSHSLKTFAYDYYLLGRDVRFCRFRRPGMGVVEHR